MSSGRLSGRLELEGSGESALPPLLGAYNEMYYPRPATDDSDETESLQTDGEDSAAVEEHPPVQTTPTPIDSSSKETATEDDQPIMKDDKRPDEIQWELSTGDNVTCGVCFQIFLDPISLGCGHSFCEVCLAGMWKVSRFPTNLLCPMCREPWGKQGDKVPPVNVQMRDILEQFHPEKLEARRANLTEEEKALVDEFTQARNRGLQQRPRLNGANVRRVGVNIPLNRTFVVLLICIFISSMTLAMIFVSSILWLIDGNNEYMLKPVRHWSNDDVLSWMDGLGESVKKDCLEVFEKEKIDGPHLLSLTDESLSNSLKITDSYTVNSLLLSIKELKENDRPEPRNFKEFQAVNQEETKFLTFLYLSSPRITFLYLYLFNYKDVFLPLIKAQVVMSSSMDKIDENALANDLFDSEGKWIERNEEYENVEMKEIKKEESNTMILTTSQLVAIAVEVILVPHVIVLMFVFTHLSMDSLLFYVLLFNCGRSTFMELKGLRNRLRHHHRHNYTINQLVKAFTNSFIMFFFSFLVASIISYLLPSSFSELIMYVILFYPLLYILHSRVLAPCLGRSFQFLLNYVNQRAQRGGLV